MSQIDYQALNDRLYRAFLDNVKDADLANDIAQLRELVREKVRIQQLEGEVAELVGYLAGLNSAVKSLDAHIDFREGFLDGDIGIEDASGINRVFETLVNLTGEVDDFLREKGAVKEADAA